MYESRSTQYLDACIALKNSAKNIIFETFHCKQPQHKKKLCVFNQHTSIKMVSDFSVICRLAGRSIRMRNIANDVAAIVVSLTAVADFVSLCFVARSVGCVILACPILAVESAHRACSLFFSFRSSILCSSQFKCRMKLTVLFC